MVRTKKRSEDDPRGDGDYAPPPTISPIHITTCCICKAVSNLVRTRWVVEICYFNKNGALFQDEDEPWKERQPPLWQEDPSLYPLCDVCYESLETEGRVEKPSEEDSNGDEEEDSEEEASASDEGSGEEPGMT